jgi:two-component system, cell cycle sensor histidine kinase and response regulator CckA
MRSETTRVLVVEDDPESRETLTAALSAADSDFRVVDVDTLAAAVTELRTDGFDVVLLDLGLPDSSGLGTFATLYSEAPDTPIVVLAHPSEETSALKAVQSGAQDYLLKGQVHGTLLVRSVRYAIERRRAEEQIRLQAQLLEAVGEAVIATDPNGVIRYWNRFAEELYGWTGREAVGRNILDVLPQDRTRPQAERVLRLVAGGKRWSGEMEVLRRDGTSFPAHIEQSPIVDAFGDLVGLVGTSSDVTDRKRADEALRASEQRLRIFVEQVPAILWSTDRDLRFTSCLGAGLTAAQLRGVDLYGQPIDTFVQMTGAGKDMIDAHRRAARGEPVSGRLRFRGRVYEAHVEPLRGGYGEVVGTIGIALDVTHTERVEEELRRSEQRFRCLVENGTDMIGVLTADFRLRYASPSVHAILGYTPEELTSANAVALVHPDDRADALAALSRIRRNSRLMPTLAVRVRHRDGSYRTVEVKARNLLDDPAMDGIVLNARDVTERMQVQEALRESNEALTALITASPVAILALDANGRVTMWNPAAERMFGWLEDDVLGGALPILPEEGREAHRARLATTLAGRSYTGAEIVGRRRDGSAIDVSLSAAPLRDGAGRVKGVVAVIEDLSPRKQLEQRLLHSQKMEAIGRLAGGIAHDFNNLLTAITGHAQILLEGIPEEDPARADLNEIDRAAGRAAALTRQLLAFSRKQVLQPTVLDVNGLVTGLERMLRRLIGADIELSTQIDPATGRIRADPGQIEQVLMNLVVNARDAMPHGGTLAIETANQTVRADDPMTQDGAEPGEYVRITISDTGIGMDPETLTRIFEPFFTTKEAGRGTGLGLSTVYGIVNQSGGHIRVQSEPGQGTLFRVFLPRVRTRATVRTERSEPQLGAGSETILLVEDEPAVRALAQRVLERYGYRVIAAGSGDEAITLAHGFHGDIDLLVTDIVMPGMSGREVAQRIQAVRVATPVLYTSGYTPETTTRQNDFITAGAPFLQKPFTPAALAAKVRSVLDAKVPKRGGAAQ